MKRILSKSQANMFIQCPYKWKRCYMDGIRSEPSQAQERGIRIHEKIEKFYKNMQPDMELKAFISFELNRLKRLRKLDKYDPKYFFPLFQELKMKDDEFAMKGILDAVFINPTDDGVIIIDWKTGKYYPNKFDDYRFELAVYKELLEKSGKVDKVDYWGIVFVDQNKIFFEKVDDEYVRRMRSTIERVREQMKGENHPRKRNFFCKWCQFYGECKNVY